MTASTRMIACATFVVAFNRRHQLALGRERNFCDTLEAPFAPFGDRALAQLAFGDQERGFGRVAVDFPVATFGLAQVGVAGQAAAVEYVFGPATHLGAPVSSDAAEECAFFTEDGLSLYIARAPSAPGGGYVWDAVGFYVLERASVDVPFTDPAKCYLHIGSDQIAFGGSQHASTRIVPLCCHVHGSYLFAGVGRRPHAARRVSQKRLPPDGYVFAVRGPRFLYTGILGRYASSHGTIDGCRRVRCATAS